MKAEEIRKKDCREQVARFRFRDVRFLEDITSVAREGLRDGKRD